MSQKQSASTRVAIATGVTACSSVVLWVEYVEMKDCITLDRENLGRSILVACTIIWGSYYISALFATEKFFFLSGLSAFVASTAFSLGKGKKQPRQLVISAMVAVWAVRLMLLIANRFRKHGPDRRFKFVKQDASLLFLWCCLQMLWVVVVCMPVYVVNVKRRNIAPIDEYDLPALLLWIIGLALETIADSQKAAFRADPKNKNEFINTGLWAHCRHPNYFGEWLVWVGVSLFAAPTLQGWEEPFAPIGSVLLSFILLRMVNIHILEQDAEHRWFVVGKFRRYQARSRAFLWLPWAPAERKVNEREPWESEKEKKEPDSEKKRLSKLLKKMKRSDGDDVSEDEDEKEEREAEENKTHKVLEKAVSNTVKTWLRDEDALVDEADKDDAWKRVAMDSWGSDTDTDDDEEEETMVAKGPVKGARKQIEGVGVGAGKARGQGGKRVATVQEEGTLSVEEMKAWQERLAKVAQRVEEAVENQRKAKKKGREEQETIAEDEAGEAEAGREGLADKEGVRRRGGEAKEGGGEGSEGGDEREEEEEEAVKGKGKGKGKKGGKAEKKDD